MVGLSTGIFRLVLLTPAGKVFDCRAGSALLPAHDGMIGILRNHMPMLCKLGSGIMQVKDIVGKDDTFFLIEGGFARISENLVTVLAYEVITFDGMDRHEAETMVTKAREVTAAKAYMSQFGWVDLKKASLIVKMARMSSIMGEE